MRNAVVLSLLKVVNALDKVFSAVGINAFGKLGESLAKSITPARQVTAEMKTMGEMMAEAKAVMAGIFSPAIENTTNDIDDLGDSFKHAHEKLTELSNKMKYASGLDFTPATKQAAQPQPLGGRADGGTGTIDWDSLEGKMSAAERMALKMNGTFFDLGDTIRQSMVNAAVGIGIFVGQLVAGTESSLTFAQVIGGAFTDLMSSLGKMMIEAGVAKMAFDLAMLIPGGAIGAVIAGTALVAAASAISGMFGGGGGQGVSAPPLLAKGGIAHGPTLVGVGEYSGISTNPEVIAPLNTLRSMMADISGASSGTTTGVIQARGRMLQVVLAQDQRINRRIRP